MTGEVTKMSEPRYIGDSVYAGCDGYHITLHLGSHRTPPVIFLEPDVMVALTEYFNSIYGHVLEFKTVRKNNGH
jgi:hypothetical protein